ncbi:MAG: hypothetical protein ACOVP4_02370 [Bacteriovoracaceae bacterium]|jgi:hypothetical protein
MKKIALITMAAALFLTSCGHMKKDHCSKKQACCKESCSKEKKDCGESCDKKQDQKKS